MIEIPQSELKDTRETRDKGNVRQTSEKNVNQSVYKLVVKTKLHRITGSKDSLQRQFIYLFILMLSIKNYQKSRGVQTLACCHGFIVSGWVPSCSLRSPPQRQQAAEGVRFTLHVNAYQTI